MGDVHRILVPTDFSECSRRALSEAIALAKKFGAELHLMHCFEMFVPRSFTPHKGVNYALFEKEIRSFRKHTEDQMSACCRDAAASGASVREHLAVDRPSVEAVELARKIGADLIVMGTRGRSGLTHVLLGSVAERTVRLAPCPVMTVGPAARGISSGADGKIAVKEIHRILVPVDFSEHAQRALDEAIEFAVAFGAEVDLLHSYPINPQEIAPYGIATPQDFERSLQIAARQRLSAWRDQVSAAGRNGQDHLAADLPSEAILETAKKREVDLIVMGTRGLTGLTHVLLGSVAERTIRTAPCPVITVKHDAGD